MGNNHCEECRELKNQNTAYGEFELTQEEGKAIALIEKKIENKRGLA